MSDQIDLNSVTAEVTVQLVKETLGGVFDRISKAAKFTYAALFPDFEKHLLSVYEQISTVKIITSRDQPVKFSNVYTSSGFKCGSRTFSDEQLIETLIAGKRCVLTGNGGAGKTFMMRNVWLEVFKRRTKRVPILVELRKLNSLSSYDILSFIRASSFGSVDFEEGVFRHFCENGAFIFLLDGFDEVVKEKREDLERQILSLSRKYAECGVIVSGRPDDRFDAWSDFYTFKAQPFNYTQFRDLISKVPFDPDTKRAFQKVATEEFFDRHRSFLSNPLLSLMMLLTFRDNAEIPSRLSTFYENCFATLYAQHDALKESFSRKKSLDQLRFKRLFSAFSLVTYLASRPSLDGAEFITAIEKSKGIAGINVSVEDISHDLLESVNLLVKEGSTYSYIHRSFQEFFAAHCVVSVMSERQEDIIAKFAKRRNDDTLRLTYELHPKLVEDKVIIPRYERLKARGSLPRRTYKDMPFNAVSKAGLSFNITFRSAVGRDGDKVSFFLYGFRINWDDDYEVITPAAIVARSDGLQTANVLVDAVLHTAVFEIARDLERDGINSRLDEYELGETLTVTFTFDPSQAYVVVEDDETSQSDHARKLVDRCGLIINSNFHKLEKIVIDNNKVIVESSEAVLFGRDRHNDILGEVSL